MSQYSGIQVELDSSENNWRTTNSDSLAVFVASLQCTDETNDVSRGIPRSRTSVTGGIR